MPHEHTPQPCSEPTSHDSIVAERRAYLEQQAAQSMGVLVGNLTRITSGKDVAEYLVNYPQVDSGTRCRGRPRGRTPGRGAGSD